MSREGGGLGALDSRHLRGYAFGDNQEVAGSGSGDINESIDLDDGGEITFTVNATVVGSLTAHQAAAVFSFAPLAVPSCCKMS